MTQISRVDQAVLLLRERLRKLGQGGGAAAAGSAASAAKAATPLASLRQMAHSGAIGDGDLRRAFVRTLLSESLGPELVTSLEFQAVADKVTQLLEADAAGRALLDRAMAEVG